MTEEPTAVWEPTADNIRDAEITKFAAWLQQSRGVSVGTDYSKLWSWSVQDLAGFWAAIWDYFEVEGRAAPSDVLSNQQMPGTSWFPGTKLNYVNHLLRQAESDETAIIGVGELGGPGTSEISWRELLRQVAALANTLRDLGVGPGDRVGGYLPNVAEAVVAFLATASLGAIWSACGQDYAPDAAAARLGQLEPVVLISADGYRYAGKTHDRRTEVAQLRSLLPSVRATIMVSRCGLEIGGTEKGVLGWAEAVVGDYPLRPEPVAFDHPLWVLFSSGTTGKPKGIVHGHGGVLLEHLKAMALHLDLGAGDVYFWYTSPSWMMWNYQVAGLLTGSTIICYDGSPNSPTQEGLWEIAARHAVTVLGTSSAYLQACQKNGSEPRSLYDLSTLRILGATGSTVPPDVYLWALGALGSEVQLCSISGGTDVVTAFAGAARTLPVWPGELSGACLGVSLEAWSPDQQRVVDEVGELVITQPMPSMPVSFWNDPDGSLYRAAYFDTFPGVWRHGDWITLTKRGSVLVHGRSDSTLNRNGIRMGSSEIYSAVDQLAGIVDSLVLGVELTDGSYWMPLFVELAAGQELDAELVESIRSSIRERVSARYLPDEILQAPGVPHTKTGKKLEIPIKQLLQGRSAEVVVDHNSVDRPELLGWYAEVGRQHSPKR